MKCYKGTILSVDASDGVYRSLVEEKGQILYVGNDLPSEYNMAEVIALKGNAIVPAFVDTHQNFASLYINIKYPELKSKIHRHLHFLHSPLP